MFNVITAAISVVTYYVPGTVLRTRIKGESVLCFGQVHKLNINLRKPVHSVGRRPIFITAHSALLALRQLKK